VTALQPSATLPLMPNWAICWEDTCECQRLMNSGHQQHVAGTSNMWNATDGKAELCTKHHQVDGSKGRWTGPFWNIERGH
jgi:hypothetical protein